MKQKMFADTLASLDGIEAIDYWFAGQFTAQENAQYKDWFMLLIGLSALVRQGHTCADLQQLAGQKLFDDAEQELSGWQYPNLDRLLQVATEGVAQPLTGDALVLVANRLYTRRYWQFEQDVAGVLAPKIASRPLTDTQRQVIGALWPVLFDTQKSETQDWQQVATASALRQRFTIISGGPGTGKTYTVTRLLLALQSMAAGQARIVLAAPTGKAAQRMNESIAASLQQLEGKLDETLVATIPTNAVTLHRLLGINRFGIDTRSHQRNLLQCDVLIVDEASMIDMALMARLVRALPDTASLILVGDADQLPAVESGNVLEALTGQQLFTGVSSDLAEHLTNTCGHLPALEVTQQSRDYVQKLQISRRFAGQLAKVASAIRVANGDQAWQCIGVSTPDEGPRIYTNEQVLHIDEAIFEPQFDRFARDCFKTQLDLSLTPQQALTAMNRCRWLTPLRRGPFGVDTLNQRIEKALKIYRGSTQHMHYAGRPVMVVENNYAQQLFNGDVGVIWPDENQQLKAWFASDTGIRSISLTRLPAVETVFAMTVHKSQGSEFEQVVMLLPEATSAQIASLCSRELLYTGITRAKKGCTLIGNETRFKAMVARRQQRFSGLADMLEQHLQSAKTAEQ
ncbi:exodeoxyribonuclease V subunit alpha [Alteromonas lipotrueiana]|uniref:exodeoxyribonuclease V subunit alpha n=1 Tax=Alteromonas lipotrueiana TaxID=2803815 RepID=UPI001C487A95|nr:exodeoxyribonuclease V subunit alpha [Alteromonas lipotrueiana]